MLTRIFKIIIYILIAIISLIFLLLVAINLSPVQQKIKNIALSEVTKITKNEISIDRFILIPFNKIIIRGLVVKDLASDTLFYAKKFSVRFNLLPLLDNRLEIESVNLDGFSAKISSDSVGAPMNFMFIPDAFRSPQPKKDKESNNNPFSVSMKMIVLTDGKLSYDIHSEPEVLEGFDQNHIQINDLNAELNFSMIEDSITVALNDFRFIEKSGLWITKLSAEYQLSKQGHTVNNLVLNTLSSNLTIPHLSYTEENNLDISLKGKLIPSDFQMFYNPLINLNKVLNLDLSVGLMNNKLHITISDINYNNNIRLVSQINIQNIIFPTSNFELKIKHIYANREGLKEISSLGLEQGLINQLPFFMDLKGELKGSLSNFDLGLELSTESDNLQLAGHAGYELFSQVSKFDLSVNCPRISLGKWIEAGKGKASKFHGNIKGVINPQSDPRLSCNLTFPTLHYNTYDYKGIALQATLANKQFEAKIICPDSLANLSVYTKGYLNGNSSNAHLDLNIEKLKLDTLNFLPENKHADLHLKMQADLEGMDLDAMTLNVAIDTINLSTERGTFRDKLSLSYSSTVAIPSGVPTIKKINLKSGILEVIAQGQFSFTSIADNIQHKIAEYYPSLLPKHTSKDNKDSINISINIKNIENLTNTLNLSVSFETPIEIEGQYNSKEIRLGIKAKEVFYNEIEFRNINTSIYTQNERVFADLSLQQKLDTSFLMYNLNIESINDSLLFLVNIDKSDTIRALKGSLKAGVKIHSTGIPEVDVRIFPTKIQLNDQHFNILPANLHIRENEYSISNFEFSHSNEEFVKLNGIISTNPQDSLLIQISKFQIPTILTAIGSDFKFQGEINGNILLNQIIEAPRLMTNDFSITNIQLDTTKIGDFYLNSKWDTRQQALIVDSKFIKPNSISSYLGGEIYPSQDSLNLKVDIKEFDPFWVSPYTQGVLFGLKGSLETNLDVHGKISKPLVSGNLFFNDMSVGINMTQCQYFINDTIHVDENEVQLRNFSIKDNFGKEIVFNGKVESKEDLKMGINLKFDDFAVLNNVSHTDSLFFGLLRLSGSADMTKSATGYSANISMINGNRSRILVNLPNNAAQAHNYKSVVFVSHEEEDSTQNIQALTEPKLPLIMRLSLDLTPDLTLGAVINPAANDQATVRGSGKLNMEYNMLNGNQSITGKYTIQEGQASISIIGITKKTFTIQPQGTIVFKGDPMKTEFDITAVYSLRADLVTLDPSFTSDINLSTTRVDVNCKINVKGDADKIELGYNIELPNVDESVQRKVAGLINSDEIKIRQIAYLLALGTFFPPASEATPNVSNNLWNSLASSSLTAQLNNLLSGVLRENWSVGTEIRSTNDASTAMDVSISTRLLDDRLTLKTNIGINNAGNNPNSGSFTGDFDARYKLTKNGSWVINMYNLTNEQYFRQAPTTQGIGVIYRRESHQFKDLFKALPKKVDQKEKVKKKKKAKQKEKE